MSDAEQALMDYIESKKFRFEANLASGLSSFKKFVLSNPRIRELREMLTQDPSLGPDLLVRINNLVSLDTDDRFEHPYDTAVAAYLLVLSGSGGRYSRSAAHAIHDAPRLWWSKRIASQIDSMENSEAISSVEKFVPLVFHSAFSYPTEHSTSLTDVHLWRSLRPHRTNVVVVFDTSAHLTAGAPSSSDAYHPVDMINRGQIVLWHGHALFAQAKTLDSGERIVAPELRF